MSESFSKFFTVEYTETRPLPKKWQWIGPASYIGIFVLTIFVAIVNVALVGYDTVSGYTSDYNKIEHHWYHAFIPSYKPMQICEPATFSVGQSLFSTVSLFNWRVVSSTKPRDRPTGNLVYDKHVIYRGETLDRCSLTTVFMPIFPNSAIYIVPMIICGFTDDYAMLTTSYKVIPNSLKRAALYFPQADEIVESLETAISQSSPISSVMDMLNSLYRDGVDRLYNFSATTQEPVLFQFSWDVCLAYYNPCPGEKPEVTITNEERKSKDDPIFQATNDTAFELAQIIAAAAAIDLGNNQTDTNMFFNETLAKQILSPELLQVFQTRKYQPPATSNFSPSRISTPFLCTYQRLKTGGSLVISVFAATFTVIAGAWNLRTIIVGYIGRESSIRSADGSKEGKESDPRHGNDQEVGETETLIPRGSADDD